MTAQKIFCDNDFARDVLESIFKDRATKNAAGILVFDCGKELNAFSILMNMMGEYLALFFEGFYWTRATALKTPGLSIAMICISG